MSDISPVDKVTEDKGNATLGIAGALAGALVGGLVYYGIMAISGYQLPRRIQRVPQRDVRSINAGPVAKRSEERWNRTIWRR